MAAASVAWAIAVAMLAVYTYALWELARTGTRDRDDAATDEPAPE